MHRVSVTTRGVWTGRVVGPFQASLIGTPAALRQVSARLCLLQHTNDSAPTHLHYYHTNTTTTPSPLLTYDSDETGIESGGAPMHPICSCVLYLDVADDSAEGSVEGSRGSRGSSIGGPTLVTNQKLSGMYSVAIYIHHQTLLIPYL